MSVKVYVEGGGDHNKTLQSQCRRGFTEFFDKVGLKGRMPRIVACGSRLQAFDRFKVALISEDSHTPILLVDSEGPVTGKDVCEHLRKRQADNWNRPSGASDDQVHLMVQTMEAWFFADPDAIQRFYGNEFQASAFGHRSDIENIPKTDLIDKLKRATRTCSKGEYSKGDHSFKILALIDPARVRAASPFAEKLLETLDRLC